MNFYVANQTNLRSALKTAYRQGQITGPQSEKTVLAAGEAIWSQVISPNFNPRKSLPYMWYEDSGFDVFTTTLQELKIRDIDNHTNPKSRDEYGEAYPYSTMDFLLNKPKGSTLLLAGILSPAKGKFDTSHLNNYFYNLFGVAMAEANMFWTLPLIVPIKNKFDKFVFDSLESLKSKVISTYLYKTVNLTALHIEVLEHLSVSKDIAEEKIAEFSELMGRSNPVSDPLGLYEAEMRTYAKQSHISGALYLVKAYLDYIKDNLPVYSKTQEGWEKIKYTR